MSNFNSFWEKKLLDYDNEGVRLEQELQVKQNT